MKDAIIRLLSSMKFWTTILGVVSALGAKYGFNVDPDGYWSIVGLFGLLLGAQGLTDHGKEAAKVTAGSTLNPYAASDPTVTITKEETK